MMYDTDHILKTVAEFMKAFAASLDIRVWLKLIEEEHRELRDAMDNEGEAAALKEYCDLHYVTAGLYLVAGDALKTVLPDDEAAKLEAMADAVPALVEAAEHRYGWSEEVMMEAFNRVHASNMSKLGDDGKPLRREDGKILKGPNYQPPVLDDLVA